MWTAFRHSFSVRGRPSPRKTLFGLIHSCPTSYLLGSRGAFVNLLASLGTWTSVFPPAFHSLLVYSLFVMMIHISRPDERAISLAYLLMNSNTSHHHHHHHHRSALLHSNLLCFNRRRHDCCLCRQYLLAVQGSCRSRERKDLKVLEEYSSSKFFLPSSSRSHFQSERLSRIIRRSDGTDGSSSVFF